LGAARRDHRGTYRVAPRQKFVVMLQRSTNVRGFVALRARRLTFVAFCW